MGRIAVTYLISALDVEFLESWYAENKYLNTGCEDEYYDDEKCIPVEQYRFKDTFTEYLDVVDEYLKLAKSNNDHNIFKRFYNSLDKDNEAHLDKWYNICKSEQAFKERDSYFVWPFNMNDGSLYHLGLRFDITPVEDILFTTDKYNAMRKREIEYILSSPYKSSHHNTPIVVRRMNRIFSALFAVNNTYIYRI